MIGAIGGRFGGAAMSAWFVALNRRSSYNARIVGQPILAAAGTLHASKKPPAGRIARPHTSD